jgi:iron-sulfur cluster assembly protein
MLIISEAAAAHIKAAAKKQNETLKLRMAATQKADGTMDYALGFDKTKLDDITYTQHGVSVIVAPSHDDLLAGATLDFVELAQGAFHFIFINPNDANHTPPDGVKS